MKPFQINRKTLVVLSAFIVIIGAAVFIGIFIITKSAESVGGWLSSDSSCLGTKPYSPEKIEQIARISLPSNIPELQVEASGTQDCEIFLSFNVEPDELSDFVSSTYLETPLTNGIPPSFFNNYPSTLEWTLDNQKTYLISEGVKNGEHQYIVVDTDDPLHYVVYFATFLP